MLKAYVFAQSQLGAFKDHMQSLRDDDSGAAMIEYALILGLIAIAAITAITALSTNLNSRLDAIALKVKP